MWKRVNKKTCAPSFFFFLSIQQRKTCVFSIRCQYLGHLLTDKITRKCLCLSNFNVEFSKPMRQCQPTLYQIVSQIITNQTKILTQVPELLVCSVRQGRITHTLRDIIFGFFLLLQLKFRVNNQRKGVRLEHGLIYRFVISTQITTTRKDCCCVFFFSLCFSQFLVSF